MHRMPLSLASLVVLVASCTGPGTGDPTGDAGAVGDDDCVLTGPVDEDRALSPEACERYVVEEIIEVRAALVVAPGTVVELGPDTGFYVDETGSLNAVGTAEQRVTFRGAAAGAGTWIGIAFRSNNGANELAFVDVDGAGGGNFCCDYFGINGGDAQAAVVLGPAEGARLALSDTTITDSGGDGLIVYPDTTLGTFARASFAGIADAPVVIPWGQLGALDAETVYLDADDLPGEPWIVVVDGQTDDDVTIRDVGAPYVVEANVADAILSIDGDVVVEAGVTMRFDANGGLQVSEVGKIVAEGTVDAPVTFAGVDEGAGTWRGLAFRSLGNVLTEVVIDGGGGENYCCDYAESANLIIGSTVSSVVMTGGALTNSASFGVFVFGDGTATISGVDFAGNVVDDNMP